MSGTNDFIDLTGDSDGEDVRSRGPNHQHLHSPAHMYSHPGLTDSPVQSRQFPVYYRDGLPPTALPPTAYSRHTIVGNYQHQYFSPRQRPVSDGRMNYVPASMHYSSSQNYVSGREANRTFLSSPMSGTPATPVNIRRQRKTCLNCAEVDVTCDGEKPCSACVEPGLLCYYPGEKPDVSGTGRLSFRAQAKPASRPTTSSNMEPDILPPGSATSRIESGPPVPVDTTKQSDLLPNQLLSPPELNPKLQTPEVAAEEVEGEEEEEAFYDSDDSEDDEISQSVAELDEVKSLLKKHQARMREHRAYLLQPLLNQAKIDASNAPRPAGTSKKRNPFSNLTAKKTAPQANTSGNTGSLLMHVKSHKLSSYRKWSPVSVPLKTIKTNPTILPKYKSIGRLGSSLLAPNIRTLKYWPYFPDEEYLDPSEAKKNEELEERYQHDDNHLLAQRKCSELVDMWRPWVKDFVSKLRIEFSDILYWFLHTTDKTTCDTCEREMLSEAFSEVSQLLVKPSERSLALARLSAMALKEIAKISMWHFVLVAPSVKALVIQMEPPRRSATTLCSVCFLHNCLSHGAYLEPEESGGTAIMGGNVEINDEELNHNARLSAAIPNHDFDGEHQCGLYCVAAESRVKDILGRRKDGKVGGLHNHTIHVPRPCVNNDTDCSEHCYWPVEKRVKFGTVSQTKDYQPKMSDKSRELFKKLLRVYSDNQRAPCMLANDIDDLTCIDAFYCMLAETQRVDHYRQAITNAAQQSTRRISKLTASLDASLSADLDERPPFIPCSHSGPCLNNPDCTCAQNKVHCEWFCGCDRLCERRFPGCKCASTNKTCFNDRSCECWKHNRECDPWLCGACGVVEVLDPQNKYNDAIRNGRCKNNRIQLELPARTIKAPSEVQGWGLYAGVDLDESAFIGEYKGETVGNQESDRRGAVYANIGQEYLFVMNRDQQIDGSNFGNKTRFINNSQRDDYINVYAKKLLCNGVQRVMLYTKRPIKAGEELLYNYNYPVSVTKKFWERGEGPTNVPGAVVAKPSITWTQSRVTGRYAKVAGKQDGEQSLPARDEPDINLPKFAVKRDAKRKRLLEEETLLATLALTAGGAVAAGESGHTGPVGSHGVHLQDDPDPNDSEFELAEVTETSESVDEAEADSDDQAEGSVMVRARRLVHPHDRRRGGLAQVKAWETRRKRNGKGK